MTSSLTLLYDETCVVCVRARDWLLSEPTYLPVELLAAGSPAARARFAAIPWRGAELVVVGDDGRVWYGTSAFLVAMWATRRWRAWSYRLTGTHLAPLANRFFNLVSKHRKRAGRVLSSDTCDDCATGVLAPWPAPDAAQRSE